METKDNIDPNNQPGAGEGKGSPSKETPPDEKVSEDRKPQESGDIPDSAFAKILKTDLDEFKRLAQLDEDHKKERAKWDEERKAWEEERAERERQQEEKTAHDSDLTDPNAETSLEDQRGIIRDLKRQEKDYLAKDKEISDLSPKQRREFNGEFNIRRERLLKAAIKANEYVPLSDLEKEVQKALRFIKQESAEEVERARLAGQKDMLDREAGNIGNTSSVPKGGTGEVSSEATEIAKRSILVTEGKMTLEAMAKKIQKRIDEGTL